MAEKNKKKKESGVRRKETVWRGGKASHCKNHN